MRHHLKNVAKYVLVFSVVAILILLISGAEGEITEQAKDACTKNCPAHNVVYVAVWYIGDFLNRWSSAIVALATAFVGAFTYTLYRSTDAMRVIAQQQQIDTQAQIRLAKRSARIARRAADIAEQTLIATNRPWLSLNVEPEGPIRVSESGFGTSIKPRVKNIGKSVATDVKFGIFHVPANRSGSDMRQLILEKGDGALRKFDGQILFPGDKLPAIASISNNWQIDEEQMRGRGALDFIFWVAYKFSFGEDKWHFTAQQLVPYEKGTIDVAGGFITPAKIGIVEKDCVVLIPKATLFD